MTCRDVRDVPLGLAKLAHFSSQRDHHPICRCRNCWNRTRYYLDKFILRVWPMMCCSQTRRRWFFDGRSDALSERDWDPGEPVSPHQFLDVVECISPDGGRNKLHHVPSGIARNMLYPPAFRPGDFNVCKYFILMMLPDLTSFSELRFLM